MTRFILTRLTLLVPVLLGVTVIVFVVMWLVPGDPATSILGTFATPENLAKVRSELGLTQPMPVRYLIWLRGVLHGDLGQSYILHRPVLDELLDRLFPTLLLAGVSLALCSVVGILLGIAAAMRQNAWPDRVITLVVMLGVSTPSFWLGMLLILWFAVRFAWLPAGGMQEMFGPGGALEIARHLVLPTLALSAVPAAVLVRLTRTAMLEVMRQDYVRTARAKGLRGRRVVYRHALRNALIPTTTLMGLQVGNLLGGAFLVEIVFSWPGIGFYSVQAIRAFDYAAIMGVTIIIAVAYTLVNLVVDVLYAVLDPRITYA